MEKNRKQLGAYLSRMASDGWKDFAAQNGCTVSALLEAVGRQLANYKAGDRLPDFWKQAIADARSISSERRERAPEPDR